MPLYEYHCPSCGVFNKFADLKDYNQPTQCVDCGQSANRLISAPNFALMSTNNRKAWETNERSAHEPTLRKKTSCGCGSTHTCGTSKSTTKPALEMPVGKNTRPWMLGH